MSTRTTKGILVDICIIVTVTIAILAGFEIGARMVQQVRNMASTSPVALPVESILSKQEWWKQHEANDARQSEEYMAYVEFRVKPYISTTSNVDAERRRRVPGSCEKSIASTIITFGGSTMYGAGVPDQYTIPAYLAELLNRDGRCLTIVNYGSGSWQSSQALIQLIEILKKGQRPLMVIFYDGINEIDTVSFGGTAGGIHPEAAGLLRRAFETDNSSVWEGIALHSVLVSALARRIFPNYQKKAGNEYSIPEVDRPRIANALVDVYATNVRIVDALAGEYGFAAYYFLQPFPLIAKKKNTVLEAAAFKDRTTNREWETDFIKLCYGTFSRNPYLASNPRYLDISTIFDGRTEELYIDSEHLLPEGNKIIAERIAREILPHLPAK